MSEIIRIRLRLIDLIKSFFTSKPDAERLSRWRGTFSALAKESISPSLDQAIRRMNALLTEKKLEDIQDEYYALFVDPFGDNNFNLMASYYFDGRNYGDTLVRVRQFLAESDIRKDKAVTDTEDSLPVMFDIFSTVIEREKAGIATEDAQAQFLNDFLIPFSEKLHESARANKTADFYQGCFQFIDGYLDLEKGLLGLT